MNKLTKNEKGFSGIEILMVVVIVALIGVVGYMVYKNKHQPNKIVTVTKTVVTPASKNTTPTTTTPQTQTNQNIVKFPELGIEITVPDSIKDLTYVTEYQTDSTNGKPITYARLTTKSLEQLDSSCSASDSALGVITKGIGTYPGQNPPTFDNYGDLQKQLTGFFIGYSRSKAACSQTASTLTVQSQQTDVLVSSLTTIKPIQ